MAKVDNITKAKVKKGHTNGQGQTGTLQWRKSNSDKPMDKLKPLHFSMFFKHHKSRRKKSWLTGKLKLLQLFSPFSNCALFSLSLLSTLPLDPGLTFDLSGVALGTELGVVALAIMGCVGFVPGLGKVFDPGLTMTFDLRFSWPGIAVAGLLLTFSEIRS